ncbi:SPOR domain-containing protein [Phyllobacterium leguminum]|uniref:Sporulation related protein n=1 Tax=Phyllobacterium leguminum TaxID=314237 RepID=A0A318T657_9HYPH|nr:SPOR domain-containing protein [Phyllobacterium leguminum]PYE89717.1 sporulation related protein [Phyllobacterium leguminum]
MTDSNYRNRDYGAARSSREDDPLMELSRIIGFDEPVRNAASREEADDFSFDLEQELVGAVEAELYAQPQPPKPQPTRHYQPAAQQGWSVPRQLAGAQDFYSSRVSPAPRVSEAPRTQLRAQEPHSDFSTSLENELNLSLDDDHELPGDFSLDAPFAAAEDLTVYEPAFEAEDAQQYADASGYVVAPNLEDELEMMLATGGAVTGSPVSESSMRGHTQASVEPTPRYPFHSPQSYFSPAPVPASAEPRFQSPPRTAAVEPQSNGWDGNDQELDEDFFGEDNDSRYAEAEDGPVQAAYGHSSSGHSSYRYTSVGPAPQVETVTVAESRVEQTDTLDLPEVDYDPEPASGHGLSALESEFAEVFTSIEVDEQPTQPEATDRTFDDIFNNAYAADYAAQGGQAAGYQANAAAQASGTAGDYYNHWANSGADSYDQQEVDGAGIPAAANENQRGRGRRNLMLASVTGAALLIGGLGYYGFSSDGSNGAPVVIAADSQPTKVQPVNPGGNTVPNQDKAVYDQVAGTTSDAPKQKALISSEEKPVDIGMADDDDGSTDDTAVNDRVEPTMLDTTVANGSEANPAFAPRRVQTMIVRPDGTIVQQEAAPAAPGSNDVATPRARPAGAQVAALTDTPAPEAAVDDGPAETGAIPAREVQTQQTPAAPARVVKTQSITPETAPNAAQNATKAAVAKPPVVPSRPAEQPVRIIGSAKPATQQANTQVASAATAATPAAASAGGYAIQIASTPTPDDAKKSYANLSRRFANVIGGHGVDIRRADVAGKGTFYRVRVNAGSKEDAIALCTRYKAAGGSCFVTQ